MRLKHELQGKSVLGLEQVKTKKNIATTRSFATNLKTLSELEERVSTFACSCSEKLRKQQSHCNALMVFVNTNKHKKTLAQYNRSIVVKLPYSSNSDITLSKYAIRALEQIFVEGYQYKKAGVIVLDFVPEHNMQQNLFDNEDPRHSSLMQVMDTMNSKLGSRKIKLANQNIQKTWIMRQERLSKRYTTDWNELLEVQ